MEEWKPCVGFSDYEVSSHGRIRRCVDSRKYKAGYVLSERMHSKGYVQVSLSDGGKPRYRLVHRLVAEAFLGEQPPGCEVAHWDGDKRNNVVGNLRWATPAENQRDRKRHGTHGAGEAHAGSKLTLDDVRDIKCFVAAGGAQARMAEAYGVSPAQICRIVKGDRWASG